MSTLSVNKITDLTDFTFPPTTTISVTGVTASGASTFGSANITSNLSVTGTANVGNLSVTGSANITSNLSVTGTANVGNLSVTRTSGRITGDFSNATVASRVMFQSSVSGSTSVSAIPNTAGNAFFRAYGVSDPTNSPEMAVGVVGITEVRLQSGITGTGSYVPMTFYTGGSERMRIDTSGNVGIGTSSPEAKVSIVSSAGAIGLTIKDTNAGASNYFSAQYNGTSGVADIKAQSSGGSTQLAFSTSLSGTTAERMRLSAAGGFSVGTTADPGAGAIYATGNITAYYSDERLKENITPIENALAKVNAISGVTYNGNDLAAEYGYDDRSQQVGVLAQEVQKVLPEAVKHAPFDIATNADGVEYSKSGETYLTVQYEKLVPLLVEAIKELTKRVEELESK